MKYKIQSCRTQYALSSIDDEDQDIRITHCPALLPLFIPTYMQRYMIDTYVLHTIAYNTYVPYVLHLST